MDVYIPESDNSIAKINEAVIDAFMYKQNYKEFIPFNNCIYYLQQDANGYYELIRYCNTAREVVISKPFNIRSKTQGYGGGSFCINNDSIYFVNYDDQRIYCKKNTETPRAITEQGSYTHGDLCYDKSRNRIVSVREVKDASQGIVSTQVVTIDTISNNEVIVLANEYDFYSSPRVSHCGKYITWICWNFPDMPWNQSIIQLAEFDLTGSLRSIENIHHLSGVSVIEPKWGKDGALYYLSDESGYWVFYRYKDNTKINISSIQGIEFGFPPYILGLSTYCIVSDEDSGCDYIYAIAYQDNKQKLVRLRSVFTSKIEEISTSYNNIGNLQYYENSIYFIAESTDITPVIAKYECDVGNIHVVCASEARSPIRKAISPVSIKYATKNNMAAYALFYCCSNLEDISRKPALIVNVHGGPTGMAVQKYDPLILYWLENGYSYVDVNYRGSTGFGREYRESLNGNWGVMDVEDCISAVEYLIANNLVDENRIVVRGNSAGGYTALRAIEKSELFKAAIVYYGVSDLESLTKTTHKFESQYLYNLVGCPETQALRYKERSPINHTDKITKPVLLIQGSDDSIVPKRQTSYIADMLNKSGKIAPYIEFSGEGHGFVNQKNKTCALLSEHYFISKVLSTSFNGDMSSDLISYIVDYFEIHQEVKSVGN